jgi:RimJ/RimL family protein N-acetyltransferase
MRREGELMQWLERFCQAKPGPVLWSIASGASHECVGQVALVPQPSPSQWWLSYWLTPAHWGQGLAREAVSSLLAQAFKQPQYAAIVAVVGTSNGRSTKLLKALGFSESLAADDQVSIPVNHVFYKLVRGATR